MCLFFEESLFCFLVGNGYGEVDSLIEKDFLFLGTVPASLGDILLVVGFPLDKEKAGELDVGGGLFEVGLKSDIIEFSIDLVVHLVIMIRYCYVI